MKPVVSILIPCHNAEKWLAETIASVLAQTWESREIIVVDDGSTDASLAIARQFESPSIKVISQPNRGASAARNKALQAAQGEFIQYLDADDLLAPDKIERQLKRLQDGNLDCVASGEWARFYQRPSEAVFTPQPLWADFDPVSWLVFAWQEQWMMHPAAWLVPRAIAQKAGEWNEHLTVDDDGEYFCRVILASRQILFCSGARTYYRSGLSSSLSGSKSQLAWASLFTSAEIGKNLLLERENSDRTRYACATRFQHFIYEVYPEVPKLCAEAELKIQALGGTKLKPQGGSLFRLMTALMGWRQAKQLQRFIYRYGYHKLALGWRVSRAIQTASLKTRLH
jgi:glycosyltransferase involved in cell wall biosynthesis